MGNKKKIILHAACKGGTVHATVFNSGKLLSQSQKEFFLYQNWDLISGPLTS